MNIQQIYVDKRAFKFPLCNLLLAKYPNAIVTQVDSSWRIKDIKTPENVKSWLQIKNSVLILGIKSGYKPVEGCRSCDFGATGLAHGCTMSCMYCYVARHTGYSNPIMVFCNFDDIFASLKKHVLGLSQKMIPTEADPRYWIYDLGGSSDVSRDFDIVPDQYMQLIDLFKSSEYSKITFSTKYVNLKMLSVDPEHKARIRFSILPKQISTKIDIGTSLLSVKIKACNDFFNAGYDVDINLAPVIIYDNWLQDYEELLKEMSDVLDERVKNQLNFEIIFLTHNDWLHGINLGWNAESESILWQPQIQAKKISQFSRMVNYRYKLSLKKESVAKLVFLVKKYLPQSNIRYAF